MTSLERYTVNRQLQPRCPPSAGRRHTQVLCTQGTQVTKTRQTSVRMALPSLLWASQQLLGKLLLGAKNEHAILDHTQGPQVASST